MDDKIDVLLCVEIGKSKSIVAKLIEVAIDVLSM